MYTLSTVLGIGDMKIIIFHCVVRSCLARLSHHACLKIHRTHAHCKLLPHIATTQVAATHRKSCFEQWYTLSTFLGKNMKIIIFHCVVRSRLARLSHHARKNGISSAAVKCIFIPFHSVNVFSLFHLVSFG